MNKFRWLPTDLTDEKDLDLVSLVSSSLGYEIDKARAFTVALLEDVNDHTAASYVNDLLQKEEIEDEGFTARINLNP